MPSDILGDYSSKWGLNGPAPKPVDTSTESINGLLNRHGSATPKGPLVVDISHEPFQPGFTLTYDGQTEDLDHVDCLQWFKDHGAGLTDKSEQIVNEAINKAFNFYRARVVISNPTKKVDQIHDPIAPRI